MPSKCCCCYISAYPTFLETKVGNPITLEPVTADVSPEIKQRNNIKSKKLLYSNNSI